MAASVCPHGLFIGTGMPPCPLCEEELAKAQAEGLAYARAALLTVEERALVHDLGDIWGRFARLPEHHSDETDDFCDAIHALQRQVMARAARRAYPDEFTGMTRRVPPNPSDPEPGQIVTVPIRRRWWRR